MDKKWKKFNCKLIWIKFNKTGYDQKKLYTKVLVCGSNIQLFNFLRLVTLTVIFGRSRIFKCHFRNHLAFTQVPLGQFTIYWHVQDVPIKSLTWFGFVVVGAVVRLLWAHPVWVRAHDRWVPMLLLLRPLKPHWRRRRKAPGQFPPHMTCLSKLWLTDLQLKKPGNWNFHVSLHYALFPNLLGQFTTVTRARLKEIVADCDNFLAIFGVPCDSLSKVKNN